MIRIGNGKNVREALFVGEARNSEGKVRDFDGNGFNSLSVFWGIRVSMVKLTSASVYFWLSEFTGLFSTLSSVCYALAEPISATCPLQVGMQFHAIFKAGNQPWVDPTNANVSPLSPSACFSIECFCPHKLSCSMLTMFCLTVLLKRSLTVVFSTGVFRRFSVSTRGRTLRPRTSGRV